MWKSTREYKKVKRKYNFINSKEYRRYFGASAMQDRYNYEDDGIKRRKKEGGRPTARWADQVTMVIQIQREITKVLSNDRWQSSNSLTRDNRTASPPPTCKLLDCGKLKTSPQNEMVKVNQFNLSTIVPDVQISS